MPTATATANANDTPGNLHTRGHVARILSHRSLVLPQPGISAPPSHLEGLVGATVVYISGTVTRHIYYCSQCTQSEPASPISPEQVGLHDFGARAYQPAGMPGRHVPPRLYSSLSSAHDVMKRDNMHCQRQRLEWAHCMVLQPRTLAGSAKDHKYRAKFWFT